MYSRKIVLHFPRRLLDKPILYTIVKEHNLQFNILKASVMPNEEGLMVLELQGEKKNYDEAVLYLQKEGVKMQRLSQDITRDDKRCVSCGACVPFCPVGAFTVAPQTGEVSFIQSKCIACEVCVSICPYRAMEIKF